MAGMATALLPFAVGQITDELRRLLDFTRDSLEEGVKAAVAGNRIGDISNAVQTRAESGGYSVVRELVGHGLGRKLHEQPEVANWGRKGTGPKMDKRTCYLHRTNDQCRT